MEDECIPVARFGVVVVGIVLFTAAAVTYPEWRLADGIIVVRETPGGDAVKCSWCTHRGSVNTEYDCGERIKCGHMLRPGQTLKLAVRGLLASFACNLTSSVKAETAVETGPKIGIYLTDSHHGFLWHNKKRNVWHLHDSVVLESTTNKLLVTNHHPTTAIAVRWVTLGLKCFAFAKTPPAGAAVLDTAGRGQGLGF